MIQRAEEDQAMKTIEMMIVVDESRRASIPLPADVAPGPHRVVVVIEEPTAAHVHPTMADFPRHEIPWPFAPDETFRREGISDDTLGLPTRAGQPAPLIDALHRTLWLMEDRPLELAEFLRETDVNRDQMRPETVPVARVQWVERRRPFAFPIRKRGVRWNTWINRTSPRRREFAAAGRASWATAFG
jgi:hypothetical protein